MLYYYISTKKHTIKKKRQNSKLKSQLLYFIMWLIKYINYSSTNQLSKKITKKTKLKLTNKPGNLRYFNKNKLQSEFTIFTFFLSKHIQNKFISTRMFLNRTDTHEYRNFFKKRKKINKMITYNLWKLIKKYRSRVVKKTIQKTPRTNQKTKNQFINLQSKWQYINHPTKFIKKIFFKNYKTKNKKTKDNVRNQYDKWIQNNYKPYFYKPIISNKSILKKKLKLNNLINHIIAHNRKTRINKIIKKKFAHKNTKKNKIVFTDWKYKFKFNKDNNVFIKKYKYAVVKNRIIPTIKKTPIKILTPIKHIMLVKKHRFNINLNTPRLKNITKINNKIQKQKMFFNTCFNITQDYVFNINKIPNVFLSYIPQLSVKVVTHLNKKNSSPLMFAEAVKKFSEENLKYTNIFFLNHMLANPMQINNINNYTPLYLFKPHNLNNDNLVLNNLKTRLYHYNINIMYAAKYKTFCIFFILNYLEQFLSKKFWVRINAQDPVNLFWKNHINTFIYTNLFLYKKFNKLISVRELLEILWLTLKNHDLQILLLFLKKKFESSHFKKHKKILSIFFDILRKNKFIFHYLKIRGFFFDIRGKVGVSGNAKKRHHSFSIGKIATTTQNVGSYFQQISVWTPTGQMGITCTLQY